MGDVAGLPGPNPAAFFGTPTPAQTPGRPHERTLGRARMHCAHDDARVFCCSPCRYQRTQPENKCVTGE
jgi:hypothetical protein